MEIEANGAGASGRLSYRFTANGFGPNCDPKQKPSFDVHHPHSAPPPKVIERAEAPPAQRESAQSTKKDAKSESGSPVAGWTPKR